MAKAKKKNTTSPIHYNGASIYTTAYGTYRTQICRNYKVTRKTFKTLPEARAWLDTMRIDVDNVEQEEHAALTPADLRDAAKARAILPPEISLVEAAMLYKTINPTRSITINKSVEHHIDEKREMNRRPETIASANNKLRRFAAFIGGDTLLSAIQVDDVERFLAFVGGTSATRNSYRRDMLGLFNWGVRKEFLVKNIVKKIPVVSESQLDPEFLSVKKTAALLKCCRETAPAYLAYICLGFFAGLRPYELQRLQWSAIGEEIRVSRDVSKVGRTRLVDIQPVLKAWLDIIPEKEKSGGIYTASNARKNLEKLRKRAHCWPWPRDGQRKTYATYHVAYFADAGYTSMQLGHEGRPAMLYRHYRGLVNKAQADAFWSLTPQKVGGF